MSPDDGPGISHKEFFEKSLTAAGEWTRFADPKALGVAVFLGFGASDLIRNAKRLFLVGDTKQLLYGFSNDDLRWEWITTVAFLGACLFAVLSVIFVSRALFPRLKPKGSESLFYFGRIAQFKDPDEYERRVKEKTPHELESRIASQVWNVARTADKKHRQTQWAYRFLLLFFACWIVARVALTFVS